MDVWVPCLVVDVSLCVVSTEIWDREANINGQPDGRSEVDFSDLIGSDPTTAPQVTTPHNTPASSHANFNGVDIYTSERILLEKR